MKKVFRKYDVGVATVSFGKTDTGLVAKSSHRYRMLVRMPWRGPPKSKREGHRANPESEITTRMIRTIIRSRFGNQLVTIRRLYEQ